jgi:hypothetical protein
MSKNHNAAVKATEELLDSGRFVLLAFAGFSPSLAQQPSGWGSHKP